LIYSLDREESLFSISPHILTVTLN
jgi:hypothetical protein